jgi:hypothetical protein
LKDVKKISVPVHQRPTHRRNQELNLEKQLKAEKRIQELKDKYEMLRRKLEEAKEVNNRNNSSRVSSYKTVDETSS